MSDDDRFLRRAIRLAMNGRGRVEPNPMVGCVLVRDGRIIGEGWHSEFGGPHAEPNALADCLSRGETPAGATAYVTLEPCCHTNKKTPPCAPKLIEAKVARVVIGCLDPNPDVNGKGVQMLQAAAVKVEVASSPLEAECMQLIASFLRSVRQKPYVTMKWAETSNRKVAGADGARLQISGGPATHLVHQLRARSDAIVVGANTVIRDDPLLTARGVESIRGLTRCVIDRRLRTPEHSKLVQTADRIPTWIICDTEAFHAHRDLVGRLELKGIEVIPIHQFSLREALIKCLRPRLRNRAQLLVEPGPTLARAFFDAGLVDRLWVIRSPLHLDVETAPVAAAIPNDFIVTGECRIGKDLLVEYLNPSSDVFFASVPSADFVLASK